MIKIKLINKPDRDTLDVSPLVMLVLACLLALTIGIGKEVGQRRARDIVDKYERQELLRR